MKLGVKFSSFLKIAGFYSLFQRNGCGDPSMLDLLYVTSQEKYGEYHCDPGSVTYKYIQESDGLTVSTNKVHDQYY